MIEGTTSVAHLTGETVLQPAIHAWEIYLRDQGRSIYTVRSFSGDLNLFASYLTPGSTLSQVTTGDINRFIQWLQSGRGVPCSPKSLARRITSVKSFFRWLNRCGIIVMDPAEKVLQQSAISPLPEILTPEEEEKALQTAMSYLSSDKPDARPYVLLSLILNTGIKKGECLSITKNHIDLDHTGGPVLYIRYSNLNARLKERNISLPPEWMKIYQQYLEQYQPEQQIFPWSPRRLEYLLEEISEKAKIKKHVSFDMCRWSCALKDWKNGLEKETIRQKMGISKIQWREISRKLAHLAEKFKVINEIKPGVFFETSLVVTDELTAARAGHFKLAPVFSTPALVSNMESTAHQAILPFLDAGESCVGSSINIRHMAATPVGMQVRIRAEVIQSEGRRILFRVDAWDEVEKIAEGEHERFIIEWERFMQKVEKKKNNGKPS